MVSSGKLCSFCSSPIVVRRHFRFLAHGAPALVATPLPPLFRNVTANPYDDPFNPPDDPEAPAGVCGIRWVDQGDARSAEEDPRRYQLRNFNSEAAAADAGFSVTHGGHCGACSSLQVQENAAGSFQRVLVQFF